MIKWIIPIMIILLSLPIGLACRESDPYRTGEEVIIETVIEPNGLGASCNISTYQNNSLLSTAWMTRNGLAYNQSLGTLTTGTYVSMIACNLSGVANDFIGDCFFTVEADDSVYTGIAILIIAAIALLFLIMHLLGDRIEKQLLNGLPVFKYIIFTLIGWLLLPLVAVAIEYAEEAGIGISNILGGLYNALMTIDILASLLLGIGIVVFTIYKLNELTK